MRGKHVGSPRRRRPVWSIGHGRLLMFTAFALTVVVAADVPKDSVHAADSAATPAEDAAIWNPGHVTYQVDDGGCHTIQTASIDTATPAIADTVSTALEHDSIRIANFSQDPDMKVVQVSVGQKNGTRIDVTIHGWLSNSACAESTSTSAQPASFATGPEAGSVRGAGSAATTPRELGMVDLADRDVALAAAASWFKQALKVVAVAAIYVAVTIVALGIIAAIAAEGGTVIAVAVQSALVGCIGFGAANLIAARVLIPDLTSTTKSRIAVAVTGCLQGAVTGIGAAQIQNLGRGLAVGARRQLSTTPAILGDSAVTVANQVGVDVTGLSSLVDGVAEGGLAVQ
jgi:hypothetical protein